jgi:hypothetical protein
MDVSTILYVDFDLSTTLSFSAYAIEGVYGK